MIYTIRIVLLTALLGCTGGQQEEPGRSSTELQEEPGWLPAESIVNDEIPSNIQWDAIEFLEDQIDQFRRTFGSAAEHGLEYGQMPPKRFCPPNRYGVAWMPLESRGEFDATIMLSDVALTATIGEVEFGFDWSTIPSVIVELRDVQLLHHQSLMPDYAMIPVGRMVVNDTVFCGVVGRGGKHGFHATAGKRIVLIGDWEAGMVRVGLGYSALLATVDRESAALNWWFGSSPAHLPPSVADVEQRIEHVVETGMFDYAESARETEFLSDERFDLGREMERIRRRGCSVSGASVTDGVWNLNTVCDP